MSFVSAGKDTLWKLDHFRGRYYSLWGLVSGLAGGIASCFIQELAETGAVTAFTEKPGQICFFAVFGFVYTCLFLAGVNLYHKNRFNPLKFSGQGIGMAVITGLLAMLLPYAVKAAQQSPAAAWHLGSLIFFILISKTVNSLYPVKPESGINLGGLSGGVLGSFAFYIPIFIFFILGFENVEHRLFHYLCTILGLGIQCSVAGRYIAAGDRDLPIHSWICIEDALSLDTQNVNDSDSSQKKRPDKIWPFLGKIGFKAYLGHSFHRIIRSGAKDVIIGSDPDICDLVIAGLCARQWRLYNDDESNPVLQEIETEKTFSLKEPVIMKFQRLKISRV